MSIGGHQLLDLQPRYHWPPRSGHKTLPKLAERSEPGTGEKKTAASSKHSPLLLSLLFCGSDVGSQAAATPHGSLLPGMESFLPVIGRQGQRAQIHCYSPPTALFPGSTWLFSLSPTKRTAGPRDITQRTITEALQADSGHLLLLLAIPLRGHTRDLRLVSG